MQQRAAKVDASYDLVSLNDRDCLVSTQALMYNGLETQYRTTVVIKIDPFRMTERKIIFKISPVRELSDSKRLTRPSWLDSPKYTNKKPGEPFKIFEMIFLGFTGPVFGPHAGHRHHISEFVVTPSRFRKVKDTHCDQVSRTRKYEKRRETVPTNDRHEIPFRERYVTFSSQVKPLDIA